MKKLIALGVAFGLVTSFATATTVLANNPSLPGDNFTNPGSTNTGQAVGASGWHYNNVRVDGIVGINTNYARSGNGSAFLETKPVGPSTTNSKADIEFFKNPTVNSNGNFWFGPNSSLGRLADLTSLSFDWYRDSASTNNAVQHPALRLLIASANGTSGYIVFERAYNSLPTPTDTWTTDDIFANKSTYNMWSTGSLPGAFSIFNTTLHQWMNSSADYHVVGVSAGVGSGWGYFRGAVDNITFGFNGANTTYNFEAVPEPATMSILALAAWLKSRKKAKKA